MIKSAEKRTPNLGLLRLTSSVVASLPLTLLQPSLLEYESPIQGHVGLHLTNHQGQNRHGTNSKIHLGLASIY